MILLTQWCVTVPNPYAAPEVRGLPTVAGKIASENERFPVGKNLVSSGIVKIEGRVFTTKSGSVYEVVGDPSPRWLEDMERARQEVDLQNPLKGWKPKE